MFQYVKYLVVATALVSLAALSFPLSSHAAPEFAITPYDLINAVNSLRVSNGLPAYSINSILMYTTQNQADFMAITGNVTHSGPGGISLTGRLLAAGYPLAGDLSLGGFRAENISGGNESTSAESVINGWTGDAPHLNTMLSPNLSEIGAGVAVNGGRVYFVIDCALPTASGAPQVVTTVIGGGPAVPAVGAVIFPVVVSTPNADGDVIHEVKAGQSLWQIAIDYGVKIDDIKLLNNLFDNSIYPGEKLLIKKETMSSTATPTESPVVEVTASSAVTVTVFTVTVVQATNTVGPSPVLSGGSTNNNNHRIMGAVMGIIALALLGGGVFTLLGNAKKE
jgi:hypothetical protein